MTTGADMSIGERIEILRRRRGLSRETLASLVGYSSEWLRQVERKGRPVDRLSTLLRLSEVLQVKDVAAFMGAAAFPQRSAQPMDGAVPSAPELRAALLGPPASGPGPDPEAMRRLPDDLADMRAIWCGSARRYSTVLQRLPRLIGQVQALGADSAGSHRLSAEAQLLASALLHGTGDLPLALLAADRALAAATRADDMFVRAECARAFSDVLLRLRSPGEARELCLTAADDLKRAGGSGQSARARAMLYLTAAEATAFDRDHNEADRLLDLAAEMATGSGSGSPGEAVEPADIELHRVRIEVVLGRIGRALRLAERVDTRRLTSRERKVRFYLTVARAHLEDRNVPGAVLALMQTNRACGEELHFNVYARHLLKRAMVQGNTIAHHELSELAEHAGLA